MTIYDPDDRRKTRMSYTHALAHKGQLGNDLV